MMYDYNNVDRRTGFTLLELLVVISIIAILATISLSALGSAKEKTYLVRAKSEFRSVETALELYKMDRNNQYPDDAVRDVAPTNFSSYLAGYSGTGWPKSPWPGSSFDWDNWTIGPEKVYQISIRFCPNGGNISTCRFPKESWASNFDINSAVYYCISGPCRSHSDEQIDYPGYCVNCP